MARVCVVGAGAIGGIVAARMATAGHTVSAIARGPHLQAIREHGLRFDDQVGGRSGVLRIAADMDPDAFGPQDLVVIGLKGPAIPAMLPRLGPLLDAHTIVVPAINGLPWWYFHREGSAREGSRIECLDPNANLFAALDCDRVIGCVVHVAGRMVEPGHVAHTANPLMVLGEPSGQMTERLATLAGWWRDSGFDVRTTAQIRLEIWVKLLGNMTFNPVAALTGYRADQVIDDAEVLALVRDIFEEGRQVAAAYGVPVAMSFEERIDLARSIGGARVSMLQDFDLGRRPEIEGLVGSVIELAQRAGVPMPTTRHVRALVTARARTLGLLD